MQFFPYYRVTCFICNPLIGAIGEGLMRKEALGQGDVKMLGFVGAFCGWQGGLFVIFECA